MRYILRFMLLTGMAVALSACLGPKTPQEVTQAFWQAVINGETDHVVEYSTLVDPKHYDGFDKAWGGFQPSWGKIIIEGDKARIHSKFSPPAGSGMDERSFVNYLVRQNETWKVDYDRTAKEVRGGALANLFGKLNQLGDDISRQLESSAKDFNAEMGRMSRELEQMSKELEQQATDSLQRYAEKMQESLKELEESIGRALEDDKDKLTEQDRRMLQEAAAEVDESRARLVEPTLKAIAESGKSVGDIQRKLSAMESAALNQYRQRWQELSRRFEEELRKITDELSSRRG